MITVVDSGGANLSSVLFALDRIGVKYLFSDDPEAIRKSDHVILPGVGAAGTAMQHLYKRDLVQCLNELRCPVLGICLGMQILFDQSEEGPAQCLGVIPGDVKLIPHQSGKPVPHMGWNRVQLVNECPIFPEEESGQFFYFVHSYLAPEGKSVKAVAQYGVTVPAVIQSNNWFGVQFHPEKSGKAGERLIRRFTKL